MRKLFAQILLVLGLITCVERCAQIVPLGGGKRDQTPPKLIEALPANKSTNFKSNFIVLKFDEFVQLKDLANQLVITPTLKTPPEIFAEEKKINISLKSDELLPNTTYRLFFGKAIADMHEGNALLNFEYIFSTGSFVDSLKVKGKIQDAFNTKAAENILIAIYTELQNDSLPYNKSPEYYTKSSESGEFTFNYLPYKSFKVYGIQDKNRNSLYDGETEKIAFLSSDLKLISDTNIQLSIFQEEAAKTFLKKTNNPYFGLTQLILNKKAIIKLQPLNLNEAKNIHETKPGLEKDTVSIFYKTIQDTLGLLFSLNPLKQADTLKIALPRDNTAKKKFRTFTINTPGDKLALDDKIRLSFLTWMDTTKKDLSKVKLFLKEDSLRKTLPISGKWTSVNIFEINTNIKEGNNYVLKTDSNAFFDMKGFSNDTIRSVFKTQSRAETGKVTLKVLLNKKQNYIIQLVNGQDQIVKQSFISLSLSSSNAATINFTDVPPGTYQAKIVFDDNANKKWDTGRLILKQQAEKVVYASKQIKVLADWEIEEEILIKD